MVALGVDVGFCLEMRELQLIRMEKVSHDTVSVLELENDTFCKMARPIGVQCAIAVQCD